MCILQVKSEIGDVDILINNAGIVTGKPLLECKDELMIKTMEVNAISHYWVTMTFFLQFFINLFSFRNTSFNGNASTFSVVVTADKQFPISISNNALLVGGKHFVSEAQTCGRCLYAENHENLGLSRFL